MSKINDGGPAFPSAHLVGTQYLPCSGMLFRDWLAGQALSAILMRAPTGTEMQIMADASYKAADAMIVARDKGTPSE